MNIKQTLLLFALSINALGLFSQTLPTGVVMKSISGGSFTMGSSSLSGSPTEQAAAPEHTVTLSPYSLSEAEITNAQYVEFLNAAYTDGLIEIVTGGAGPDMGKRIIRGTASSTYQGKVLYNLDGIRVLKDHDDADTDGNPFTGNVEPENPLNIAYIGFNSVSNTFYVKNPKDSSDFHWYNICNYQDYSSTPMATTGPVLNDFNDWAGAGANYSSELQGWTATNPSAAVNLPTLTEVSGWPVTFIRWWGARAFAEYYNVYLPTEAQWEYAAKGGSNYTYAVHDGSDVADANWNKAGLGKLATGHVRSAISGTANPFGLYNLAGNVWEWTEDNYVAPYSTSAVTDPLVLVGSSTTRCWRGGSWNYHEATLQSAIRFKDEEDRGNDHFGFRISSSNPSTSILDGTLEDELRIYPNPCADAVFISGSVSELNDIKLYTVYGQEMSNRLHTVNRSETYIMLDLSELCAGIYILQTAGKTYRLYKR